MGAGPLPRARAWGTIALLLGASGCFSHATVPQEELAHRGEPVICRIRHGGETIRAIVEPGDVTSAVIRCRPCLHGPESWPVRYGGWPAVYSSGKYWREQTTGELIAIPADEVESVEVEEFSWPRTIVAFPVCFPTGVLDFLARNVQLGFEAVNDRFDSFSRPPATGKSPVEP